MTPSLGDSAISYIGSLSSSVALVLYRHYSCSGKSYTKRPHKPAGDVELPGHVEHAAGPGESLNLPSSHAVHVPQLGPVYPAMHAQSSVASLAAFTCAQMHTHTHTHTCYASCALHARLTVDAFMHTVRSTVCTYDTYVHMNIYVYVYCEDYDYASCALHARLAVNAFMHMYI